MRNRVDLDTLDRATLRVWRASNLVGWGLAGLAASAATGVVGLFAVRMVGVLAVWPATLLMAVVALACSAFVGGTVIGRHVYRWPFLVALVAFPTAYLVAFRLSNGGDVAPVEWAVPAAIGVVLGCITGAIARREWSRRPRALRLSGDA